MKHRVAYRKLSRDGAHRQSLLKTLVTQLIEHERIETTVAKAKEVRRVADRIITIGKRGTQLDIRKVHAYVQTVAASEKVYYQLAQRFEHRQGGYTRVLKTRFRLGDNAPMAVIEWSDTEHSILTREQLDRRQERKTKFRRLMSTPPAAAKGSEAVGLGVALT